MVELCDKISQICFSTFIRDPEGMRGEQIKGSKSLDTLTLICRVGNDLYAPFVQS